MSVKLLDSINDKLANISVLHTTSDLIFPKSYEAEYHPHKENE